MQDLLLELEDIRTQERSIDAKIEAWRKAQQRAGDPMDFGDSLQKLKNSTAEPLQELCLSFDSTKITAQRVSTKIRELDRAQQNLRKALELIDANLDLKLTIATVEKALEEGDLYTASKSVYRILSPHRNHSRDDEAHQLLSQSSFDILVSLEKLIQTKVVDLCQKRLLCIKSGDISVFQETLDLSKLYALLNLKQEGLDIFCSTAAKYCEHLLHEKGLSLAAHPSGAIVEFLSLLPSIFDELTTLIRSLSNDLQLSFGMGTECFLLFEIMKVSDTVIADILVEFIKSLDIEVLSTKVQIELNQKLTKTQESKDESTRMSSKIDIQQIDDVLEKIAFVCREVEIFETELRAAAKLASKSLETEHPHLYTALQGLPRFASLSSQMCRMSRSIECVQQLNGYFVPLENYFLQTNLESALKMDEISGFTSTAVDDVFFLVKKCVLRTFSLCSLNTACAIVNLIISAIVSRVVPFFKMRLRGCMQHIPPGYGAFLEFIKSPSLNDNMNLFTCTNNLYKCAEFTRMMHKQMQEEYQNAFQGTEISSSNQEMVKECFHEFASIEDQFQKLFDKAIRKITKECSGLLQSQLDAFIEFDYKISETRFSQLEREDPFAQSFVMHLNPFCAPLKKLLFPDCFDTFSITLGGKVAQLIESIVSKKSFSLWGGLQLDKDIRTISTFFSSVSQKSFRETFSRLNQISSLLQLERASEVLDYWTDDEEFWTLSPDEVKSFLKCRSDFSDAAVDSLNLWSVK